MSFHNDDPTSHRYMQKKWDEPVPLEVLGLQEEDGEDGSAGLSSPKVSLLLQQAYHKLPGR